MQRLDCANCHDDGHRYSVCTANTGPPLRPDLAEKDKAKKQKQRTLFSLVNSVRRIEVDQGGDHQQRLLLCVPPGMTETVDLTGGETSASTTSPVYSPTTPASSDDDYTSRAVGNERVHVTAGNPNVPFSPQRLQLQLEVHVCQVHVDGQDQQVQQVPPAM